MWLGIVAALIGESGPWAWVSAGMVLTVGPALSVAKAREDRALRRQLAARAAAYLPGIHAARRER